MNIKKMHKEYQEIEKLRKSLDLSFNDIKIVLHLEYKVPTFSIRKMTASTSYTVKRDNYKLFVSYGLTEKELDIAESLIQEIMNNE